MRRPKTPFLWIAFAGSASVTAMVGCSSADQNDGPASGGAGGLFAATGGVGPSSGGQVSVPTGGAPAGGVGNAPGTGGAIVPPSGSGGALATGGAIGTGGGPSTGGTSSSGGSAGMAGSAGAGGSAGVGGSAGASGSAGSGGTTSDPCGGGKVGSDSSKTSGGSEYGAVKYQLATSNQITDLKTTMIVPTKPMKVGTLFIWPGLQWLGGSDPARLGNGILQPVLTWGGSCAPMMPTDYSSWWIAAMYVNVSTAAAGPTGCVGGSALTVDVGDALMIDMVLNATTWRQVITDARTSKTVDFSIDLKGQSQDWATWAIELPMGGGNVIPNEGVVFTDNVLTFASKVTSCQPSQRGPNDSFTAPELSPDGLHCCISKIVLRARGVPTTP